jgi:hypothetical protein
VKLTEKPKYCVDCGSKLRDKVVTTFDPQTGKRIKTVTSNVMYCHNEYCFNVYVKVDNLWIGGAK